MKRLVWFISFIVLGLASPVRAQQAGRSEELLLKVPDGFGVCLVISDLRGYFEKWHRSPWMKAMGESPLGKAIQREPGYLQLEKLESELKSRLNISWQTLRDDILGESLVLAYQPGPPEKPTAEQGLILLKARRPDLLAKLIEDLNKLQIQSGELKEVIALEYKGHKYFRRQEKDRNHYYFLDQSFLAFSSKEGLIHQTIDRHLARETTSPLAEQIRRSGSDNALAALWLNPRTFDAELRSKAKDVSPGEALVRAKFLDYWKALDGVVLGLDYDPAAGKGVWELRLSLRGRFQDLPGSGRRLWGAPPRPSQLWNRFPEKAMLTVAGQIDFQALAECLGEFIPEEVRNALAEGIKKPLGIALGGLDFTKDILPNIGPDYGLTIALPEDQNHFPHLLAALAVRQDSRADQALFNAVHFIASLGVLSSKNSIRMKTVLQDNVEVKYLEGEKVFPPGFQPALALKGGFLLMASSPAAIQTFASKSSEKIKDVQEIPILRLSLTELARLLRQKQKSVVALLAEKNKDLSPKAAEKALNDFLAVLDLLDQVEMSQRSTPGQIAWIVRLRLSNQ